MFSVDSTIKLNFSIIRELTDNAQTALELTTGELLTKVKNSQVMPFEKGTLNNEGTFDDYSNSHLGVTSIISDTPYARRWYYNPETVNVRDYIIKKGKRAGQKVSGYTAGKAKFSREEHIKATDHWFDDWLPGGTHENFCVDTFAEHYRRLNRL